MTSIKQALDKGWKLFQAGELREAEQVYLEIRKQDPKQVDALHLLGIIAAQTGQASKAIEYFRSALRLRPGWAAAHNNLGNVFVNQKNFSQAVDSYRKAVKAKPDFALAYNNLGNALRECGRLAEAADSISQALRLKSDYPEAHSNLGIVLQTQGKLTEATASFQEAVRLNPNLGEVHINLANLLLGQGQEVGAMEHYQQALCLKPDNSEVHNNLANLLRQKGELAEAAGHLSEAIRLNPDFAEAHHSLGIVLKEQGRLPEAVASYQRALQLKPDYAEAYVNLGNAFQEQGNLLEAADYYRQALSCKPDYAQASNNLGSALLEQGNLPEAEARLLEAVRLEPVNAAASYNLGIVLWRQGRLEEAADCYLEALRLQPEYAEAHLNLGNVRKDQGRLDDAIACYRAAVEQNPAAAHMHSNLVLCLHYHPGYDAAAFYDESRRWNQQHAEPLKALIRPHTNRPEPERRLRIGYVSPDFREHVDSFFTIPLLSNHDHRQFEIFCYANVKRPDAITERLRGFADVWRSTVRLSDQQIADMIRADQIDILIDLELHVANNRLLVFARKPAPVQVAWLGCPGTTGLSTMDYRLTDPYLDPLGMFDAFSSEEVVRLPDTFWCYDPGTHEPPVNALPALEAGFITFGCLNTFCKVNKGCLVLWARVLQAVPNSRLLLRAPTGPTRDRVLATLRREGIAASRVEFVGKVTRPEYLKLYHRIDVGLDPSPYNGHTTSLDSFWMGVPPLTLVGRTVVGRAGWSQLCNLGLQELAAESADQFVARAVEWSADLQRLQALRSTLRQRMLQSPLMDGKRFAFYVEQAYRQMWRRWCNRAMPSKNDTVVAIDRQQPNVAESSDEAETHFKHAFACAKEGRFQEAIDSYRRVLSLIPDSAGVYNNLGNVYMRQGNVSDAVASYGQAVRLRPDHADAHSNLGNALRVQGRLPEAVLSFQESVRLQPNNAGAHNNMGIVLHEKGKLADAESSLRQAIRLAPTYAEAYLNLGNLFKEQARLDDAIAEYRNSMRLDPKASHLHSNLLLAMHYHPGFGPEELLAEYRRWNLLHAEPLATLIQPHTNSPDPQRRLRIGYVSPGFRNHVDSYFTVPLLSNHDHQHYEIFCYADVSQPDGLTERLRGYADVWRPAAGLSDQQLADTIRHDGIDILVDLPMHTAGNRLLVFARKPAPVQVSWLGYPGTTGLATIDYRLTDPYLDPEGLFDTFYVEESIRLPNTFWCYDPLTNEPAVNSLPALQNGFVTFGCLNNFCKINDGCLVLWARVMRAAPNSRLLLRAPLGPARDHVLAVLEREGITASRVEFVDKVTRLDYLQLYHRIDVGLDPGPYNGHTTSLDSFWMGVPVLTLVGRTVVGRAGWSQLCNLGLQELAAVSVEQFVKLAADLAGDLPRLQALRSSLRQRMQRSPLMNANRFARDMERAFREMWHRWCSQAAPTAVHELASWGRLSTGLEESPVRLIAESLESAWTKFRAGQLYEAEQVCLEIVREAPEQTAALRLLGLIASQTGRDDLALDYFRAAVRLEPDSAEAHCNLGNVFVNLKNLPEALACYEAAVRLRPAYALAYNNLGNAQRQQGLPGKAEVSFRQALEIEPDYAEVHNNLGSLLQSQGMLTEAVVEFRTALNLGLDVDPADFHMNLGNMFRELGRLDESIAAYRTALEFKPNAAHLHSNLLVVLHYHPAYDAERILAECRRWNEVHAVPLEKFILPHTNLAVSDRRLRIGYISPGFYNHVDSFFTIPLLSNHDHKQYEIFCYSDVTRPDEFTERLRGYADVWRNTVGVADEQVAEIIRNDRIDILVDLSMHTANNRLLVFARKPAPVQVNWLGYPGTTGLSTIDYRLTDPYLDPPGMFDAFYSEESIHVPETFWCYDPCTDKPSVSALPALENGFITFGCLNTFCKINDEVLALWAQVLTALPKSRLLLRAPRGAPRERVLDKLQREHIAAARVRFVGTRPRLQYLKEFQRIDLCLDPLPCNGHTTSLDAMWMGVPTLTLVSKTTAFGRAGWSQLSNLGLQELAADAPEQFVALATRLAADLPKLQELRGTLRQRMMRSPLMDANRFARHMEGAYREMWRRWCQKSVPAKCAEPGSENRPTLKNAGDDTTNWICQALAQARTLYESGQLAEAEQLFLRVLEIDANQVDSLHFLGLIATRTGRTDQAIEYLEATLRIDPNSAIAHSNLGNALREKGNLDEALINYDKALRIQPDFGNAQFNRGCVLQEQRKFVEAVASYQHAARLMPDFAEVYYNLGLVLWDQGKLEDSVASFRHAIQLEPDHAMAYHNMGVVFKQHGQYVDAEASLQESLRLEPDNAEAYLNLGNVFKAQSRLDEAIAAYRTAFRLKPEAAYIHSNLILCFHYHPDYDAAAYYEECRRWNQQHAEPLKALIKPHSNLPEPERKLRIGYVSPDFREHVDSFFLIPLLANHDRKKYEIFCYSNVTNPDYLTERIRDYADVWRCTVRMPDEQMAEMIRNDQIDILIDLELHIANNRLLVFARKPAPVQVSWLGYPGTTGLSTMDYRLTDPYLDPPGLLDAYYSEESIRLPDTFWCYDPLTDGPEVGALPALENGFVTFGCLNAFCKINDKCLSLWARVLQAVPNSRLLLRVPRDPARDRVLSTLEQGGIAASRVEFVHTLPRLEYLKAYQRIDCCLDPLPCNGHTTSLDTFWMGVPTITLVSKTTAFGRAGWSQLSNLCLTELAADTADEYVARAAQLAADLPRLQELRRTLRERLQRSPLMDGKRFALQMEQVYRQIWRRWCTQKNHSAEHETAFPALPAAPQGNDTKNVSTSQLMGAAWKCHQAGQWEEAERLYLRILQINPEHIDALHFLGLLASQTNRLDLAIENLEAVVRLQPQFAEAHGNLGHALLQKGRLAEAETSLEEALRLKPDHAEAHQNLGNVLLNQRRHDEAVAEHRRALALKPQAADFHSTLILGLQYHPDQDAKSILTECRSWNQHHAEPLREFIKPHVNRAESERRLRIGYVSPDFREHVDSFFTIPLLSNHDHRHCEIFCYSDVARSDHLTERLRGYSDVWRSTVGLSDEQVAEMIRGDQIDIMVDLELHMSKNRLLVFARKPAPVQVSWLGCPGTTGLSTMDYRLTDPYLDPPGLLDDCYSEESVRLPETFWCYDPLVDVPAINDLPALQNGFLTFGCLNFFAKINDRCLELWARVMRAATRSRLLLRAPLGRSRDVLLAKLQQVGISPERVELVDTLPRNEYLELYHRIDLALDPFPCNGHTTSLDAFWMGVPTLTLVSEKTAFGRAGWSQLCNLNLKEFAAQTPERLVASAARVAADLRRLAALRRTLRQRMQQSPLMDGDRFARHMEQAYRQMWRNWCRRTVPGTSPRPIAPVMPALAPQVNVSAPSLQQSLRIAWEHYNAGRLSEAEDVYRRILQVDAKQADALHLLGVIAARTGRIEFAVNCLDAAVRMKPEVAGAHNDLGNALVLQRRHSQAVASFRQAVRLEPDFAQAHSNLGNALREQGNLAEAVISLREAARLSADKAQAHVNLGLALEQQGNERDALASFRQAVRLEPGHVEAHFHLGLVLGKQGKAEEAVDSFRQALDIKSDHIEAHFNLGVAFQNQGKIDEAIASWKQALRHGPKLIKAHAYLGHVLRDQGQLDEAIAEFRAAVALEPDNPGLLSNIILASHLHPDYDAKAIYEEACHWNQKHAEPLKPFIRPHTNVPQPERRLRIGYVSPDFREHVDSFFTLLLLSNHDHRQFEIYCYAQVARPDAITEQLRGYADVWRSTIGLTDQQVAEMIRNDGIDILVDLELHVANNRLTIFARKPAPVQVAWLGYPGTTGLSAMDYRLTDPYLDPPGSFDPYYSEVSVRLPDTFWCYDPLTNEPIVNPLPALSNGFVTFACLNNFSKVNGACLALWAQVLHTAAHSRLLMLAPRGEARARVLAKFEQEGIAASRIEFADKQPRSEYLKLYHRIDLGLDPSPYNGHTTSLDALWMGVPSISLVSNRTAFGRAGWSQLNNLGLAELAAETPKKYVTLAAQLAADLPRLQELRSNLRGRLQDSPLMDGRRFALNVEQAFRQMWRRWCQRAEPSTVPEPVSLPKLLDTAWKHLEAGRLQEAETRFLEILHRDPDQVACLNAMGVIAAQTRRNERAIEYFNAAIRIEPRFADAYSNLGNALGEKGNLVEALASYDQAIRLEPELASAYFGRGSMLQKQRRFAEAEVSYQQALRLNPNDANSYMHLGYLCMSEGRLDDAIGAFQSALRCKVDVAHIHSALCSILPFHPGFDGKAILAECQRWNLQYAAPLKALTRPHTNSVEANRRLRVGYVSPGFQDHVIAKFMLPLLSNHDHTQCEIFCYADVVHPDRITERLRGYADAWRSTVGCTDEQVADMIRNDQIDILVDLIMHVGKNRLLTFARKPAPVQVTWLAYPGTTGLSTMDYRLTDPYLDPPGGSEADYCEESIRLPETFWCYDPLVDESPVSPLPALHNGYVTFGCLNNFWKINDGCLALWWQVLNAVPNSRLLLSAPQGNPRGRVWDSLKRAGISSARLEFAEWLPRQDYLKLYTRIDIGLDPLPYNGGTTTLDGLWMGVPTLTLPGKTVVGRMGWSLLSNLGLKNLVAATPEEYVTLATKVASDLPKLQDLRSTLRQRLQRSPLMDGKRFAFNMEQAFRQMWRRWCEHTKPAKVPQPILPDRNIASEEAGSAAGSLQQLIEMAWNHYKGDRLPDAEKLFLEILQRNPNDVDSLNVMGVIAGKTDRNDLAIDYLQAALRLNPDFPQVSNNLGNALTRKGELPEALISYQRALRLKPDYAEAYSNQANAFRELGQLDEAIASYRAALELNPNDASTHSTLILTLHYHPGYDASAYLQECLRWNQRHAEPLRALIRPHTNPSAADRRLRIGYVSGDFRDHVDSFFTIPLLSNHDRSQCMIFCYSNVAKPDALTERLRGFADVWRSTAGLADEQVADMIRSDQIDILVDLEMHVANNQMLVFARKPAPVQVAWLGYPGTTGLSAMDYRLTDPYLDPPGLLDACYSEESVRLPDTFWCYDPLTNEPAVNALPALHNGFLTFGCLNTFCKINDGCLSLWAKVLQAAPRSRLVLRAPPGKARDRVLSKLQEEDIIPTRVEFVETQPRLDYLKLYHRIDVGLDPTPCNGHTTSLDACWMGVPTITLVSTTTAFGRAGWSQLCNLGLQELAAHIPEHFVAIAGRLSADLSRLQELRVTLRERLKRSPLMDGKRFAVNVEEAYRRMWRRWRQSLEALPISHASKQRNDRPTVSVPQLLLKAWDLYQRSQLLEAEPLYLEILRADPNQIDARHFLGLIAARTKRADLAIEYLNAVVRQDPNCAEAHCNMGNVWRDKKNWAEAVASYNRALQIKPDFGDAHFNRGYALQMQGKFAEAVEGYQQAGRLSPRNAEIPFNIGIALWKMGRPDQAEASYRQALNVDSAHAMAYHSLGIVLKEQGRLSEAQANCQRALQLKPDYAEGYLSLGNVFKLQGRLDDAIAAYRKALQLEPGAAYIQSSLILTTHYHPGYDAKAIHAECRDWNQQYGEPLKATIQPHSNVPEPERKLRVGYVSPDFRDHVDALFLVPLLSNHNRQECEIFCYSDVAQPDSVTEHLRGYADVWRSTVGLADDQVAGMIRADQIDVLVDLELHMANNRLLVFARKPAPVQVAWLGYPGTTGLSTMDYRLTDLYLDPPGVFDGCYSEETIRLPDSFWCYDPLTSEPLVNPLPALQNGFITFGCLNAFCKINDECLSLWARVLHTTPGSRLLLRAPAGQSREHVSTLLEREGIVPSRLEFIDTQPRLEYLKVYQRIDISLDPLPCNGHTTSLDAFWMGVPTLTLVSTKTAFGRAGWSQLCNLGLKELAAETPVQFSALVAQLAADLPRLQELRAKLRERMLRSPLMDGKRFAADMEGAYRQMWRRWCLQGNRGK